MKENILTEIVNILKMDERFVSQDGILLKNILREKAEKLDEKLISNLFWHTIAREKFFKKIWEIVIFDTNKFIKFISHKEFLPDSYTNFKNKIGLAVAKDEFLSTSNHVVLNFPFKDCVLIGGQKKEEWKTEEKFYNEILWQDEIDVLFDKKIFTNFQKININGSSELMGFSTDENNNIKDNLIIKWNNLVVLHSLKEKFAWKIKLIYIDPPYNTGNDSFQYNDRFNHSTWLVFMKNRLEIAKDLLADDGAIFVQCDDNEQAYLKVLMDEIFGRENFRECIAVKTSTPSWVNAVNVKRGERLFKLKEYILFYSKKQTYRFYPIFVKAEYNENYKYEVIKQGDVYTVRDVSKEFSDKKDFVNYCLKNNQNIYSLEKNNKKAGEKIKAEITKSLKTDEVIEFINSKDKLVLIYNWWVFVPLAERIVKEWKENYFWTLVSDYWDDEIFQSTKTEWWVDFSNAKKPEKLLKRIIELGTREWDIVLDYHLWSATTAAVAHKMNRQYIGIEQMDYVENISVKRMQSVIEWEKSWISKNLDWKWWGEFVYMELAEENQKIFSNIKNANTVDDLIKIYNEIQNSDFLHYLIDENILNFENLAADDFENFQKFLFEIIDKNLIYKNFSEINDANNNISPNDKKLNNLFYNI